MKIRMAISGIQVCTALIVSRGGCSVQTLLLSSEGGVTRRGGCRAAQDGPGPSQPGGAGGIGAGTPAEERPMLQAGLLQKFRSMALQGTQLSEAHAALADEVRTALAAI